MPNQVSPPHDFFVNQPELEPEPGWENQHVVWVAEPQPESDSEVEEAFDADVEADYEDSGEPVIEVSEPDADEDQEPLA